MDTQQLLVGLTAINVMLVATAWTGPSRRSDPKVIRAQSIELVDESGQVRAQLHLGVDGSGNLRLKDARGNVRVKLGTSVEGTTGLLLMDQSIEPAISLATGKPGTSITLVGAGRKRQVIKP